MSGRDSPIEELSTAQYRALIRQGSDAVSIVAADGTIRYQSPNSPAVKGWPREELIGENILDYVHPDDRPRVVEEFGSLIDEDGYIDKQIEFRFRTKDRGWVWLEVTGTSPGPESSIDGYITTSRDISARKERERKVAAQRDNLQLLNQVLRHDLRNDLQVVTGYLELLAERTDADTGEMVETARESAEHAIDLTTTAGEMAEIMLTEGTETERIDLQSKLDDAVEAVRSSYPDATVTVEGSVPPVGVSATEMLDSVFDNLLSNAIQHNDKPTPEVTVSAVERDGTVLISVADNGPGVADDQKDRIFGEGNTGLGSEGTGIGLYLVRSLVDLYGGDVWIEDNQPEGSVFNVELPVHE
jgi:PAS domain S-box-containing protein